MTCATKTDSKRPSTSVVSHAKEGRKVFKVVQDKCLSGSYVLHANSEEVRVLAAINNVQDGAFSVIAIWAHCICCIRLWVMFKENTRMHSFQSSDKPYCFGSSKMSHLSEALQKTLTATSPSSLMALLCVIAASVLALLAIM